MIRRNDRQETQRRRLAGEFLEPRILLTSVTDVLPIPGSHRAPTAADVIAVFDQNLDPASVTPQTIAVHGRQSPRPLRSTAILVDNQTATLDPSADFAAGELVQVSITDGIHSSGGEPAAPFVWQFRTGVTRGSGSFVDSQQLLGPDSSSHVALGDLDDDGDLDAFVVNGVDPRSNRVYLNVDGRFTDSGQELGLSESYGVSLGDLDGDGDLDAFVTNLGMMGAANRVWFNDAGIFTDSGQRLGDHWSTKVALGDIDGDGDLDAFVANGNQQPDRVWVNDGGEFHDNGQRLGTSSTQDVDLVDLDGDGDLDAFLGIWGANQILWNDGGGQFTDSGQRLGDHLTMSAEIGDLDGDGDLDAFTANFSDFQANRVWFNDAGVFTDSGQAMDAANTWNSALGDVDGDGDLDVVLANLDAPGEGNSVWLNDGGRFTDSGQLLGDHATVAVALGDLDNDGDLDAFSANLGDNRVWLNELPALFYVSEVEPTTSGFVARFNRPLDPEPLNLFDTNIAALGPADLVVTTSSGEVVRGSLIVARDLMSLTFIQTGGPLAADTYSLTFRSGAGGMQDSDGNLLNATPENAEGRNAIRSFVVSPAPANAKVIGLPDFVRGPGQTIELPADTGVGIPLSISDGALVRSVELRVTFDPTLLSITTAVPAVEAPAGATVTVDASPGLAIIRFESPTNLPAGEIVIAELKAVVPSAQAGAIYGSHQVIDLHSLSVRDSSGASLPAAADDAVHVVAFFADVSANARINAGDASLLARVAGLLDSGFKNSLLVDPMIVADISGNRRINASDASLVARYAALELVPEIPAVPGAVATTTANGAHLAAAFEQCGQCAWQLPADAVTGLGGIELVSVSWAIFPSRGWHAKTRGAEKLDGHVSRDVEQRTSLEQAVDELFHESAADEDRISSGTFL